MNASLLPDKNIEIPVKGILYACIAFFLFSCMSMFNKLVADAHHSVEVVFYRNLLGLIGLGVYLIAANKLSLLRNARPKIMAARVIVGTMALLFTLSSMRYLPMSYATTLFFISTLLVPILATVFLKEKVGYHRIAAILVGFCGVILVAQPSGQIAMIGVVLALLAGVGHSIVHILLRALKKEPVLGVTFYFFLGGVVFPLPLMPFMGHVPEGINIVYLLMVGLTGCGGQYFLTAAAQHAPASVVSPFNYTGLLWSLIFDFTLWGLVPDGVVILGAVLIIGSSLYILYRERKNSAKIKNNKR